MAQRLVVKKAAPVVSQMMPHFHYRFEPHAKPINCTTLPVTNTILNENFHPLYIPVQRRLHIFNANQLHWAVRCPAALSRKRTIRMWALKRIREAFLAELRHSGYDRSGFLLPSSHDQASGTSNEQVQLKGALCIHVRQSSLTAPISEIRQGCSHILKKVVKELARAQSHPAVYRPRKHAP